MSITLLNTTSFDAHFRVMKGEQVVTSVLAIPQNASVQIRTGNQYTVTASTTIDGNVYTSAPMSVEGNAGFLAQVIQDKLQQTATFNVVNTANASLTELQFERTCLADVLFTISRDGKPLQNIVLRDSVMQSTLTLSENWSISAVINGITTGTVTTGDMNARIRATQGDSMVDTFRLELS